jgi:hypothetical protein
VEWFSFQNPQKYTVFPSAGEKRWKTTALFRSSTESKQRKKTVTFRRSAEHKRQKRTATFRSSTEDKRRKRTALFPSFCRRQTTKENCRSFSFGLENHRGNEALTIYLLDKTVLVY